MTAESNTDHQDAPDSLSEQVKALFQQQKHPQTWSLHPRVRVSDFERVLTAETFHAFESARRELFMKLSAPPEEQRRRALAQEALSRPFCLNAVELKEILDTSPVCENSEFHDRERCLVDYILNQNTNFTELMKEFGPRRVGADIARTVIAVRAFGAISDAYWLLRRECARQLVDFCMGNGPGSV